MDVIRERVAGLDVHKKTVVACVRVTRGSKVGRECRSFATMTADLVELLKWLTVSGCTHVAMEATGVYWKPVWNILSDGPFELMVANAAHIKNVPGRKSDLNDAMWIADLLACGLIKASFVPEEDLQELRTLMRTRKQLIREQTSHVQRLQKTLEEANIKLDAVISDLMGVSGRRMLEAMIQGVRDPRKLASLADRRLKAKPKELYDALHGRLRDHHRFLLRLHLAQWDALDAAVREIDQEADARITQLDAEAGPDQAPFRDAITNLSMTPGIGPVAATAIIAEIGLDMSRFASAANLISWAGWCPDQNESAGKRKKTRLRKGAPWLKTILVQCAWAAKNRNGSYYKAQFLRLQARRGPQKAVCAVAASLLTAIYHMLKNRTAHRDLGAGHFDRRPTEAKAKRLLAQLANLGYQVQIQPAAAT